MRKSATQWALVSGVGLVLILSALPARGMEDSRVEPNDALQQQIDALRARVAELEEQLVLRDATGGPMPDGIEELAEPAAVEEDQAATLVSREKAYLPSRGRSQAMHYGIPEGRLDVHAFVDLDYIDAGPDGSRSGVSTFDNHHANVFLRSQMHPKLLAHVELEFEHGGEIVEIDQAYLEWTITDWLSLSGPRFYTPFGIERFVWYAPTNLLVSRPQPMRQIIPGNFYANGLIFSGHVGSEKHRFTYETAVSNGLGEEALRNRRKSRQFRDNNSNRAVSGRVAFALWPSLEVGSSYYAGRYSTDEDLGIDFLGFDLATRWKGFEFRGEYVDAAVERPGGLNKLRENGWYGQLAYLLNWDRQLLPKLALITRYDSVDLDRSVVGNDDQRLWSWGLNATIYRHFHIKGEYRFVDEDGARKDNNEFLTQLVIDF